MQKWTLTLCILGLLAGCKPDADTPPIPSDTAATFSLSSPNPNIIYPNGVQIQVTGNVSDQNGIKKVRLEIRHRSNGTVYNSQEQTLSNVGFHFFHWTWNVTGISTLTSATIRIISTDRYDYQSTHNLDIQLDN